MKHTTKYWVFQLAGWSSYAIFLFFVSIILNGANWETKIFLQIAVVSISGLLASHIMRTQFKRLKSITNESLSFALYSCLLSALMALLMTGLSEFIETLLLDDSGNLNWKTYTFQAIGNFILLMIWNLIYFLYHFFIQSFQQRMTNLSLEFAKNEAELNQLKNQLNPHFLFNALNAIRALIEINPAVAKRSLTQLSDVLRRTLQIGKQDTILLTEELKLVQNYLELEKMRFDERLQINWKIDNPDSIVEIPPFSLQLIVENAIKHGIGKLPNGGIVSIEIKHVNNMLSMSVTNPGKLQVNSTSGIGLENLKNRLLHLYGKNALFGQVESNDIVQTTILIPNQTNLK